MIRDGCLLTAIVLIQWNREKRSDNVETILFETKNFCDNGSIQSI